ncbi:MAG: hypothetical protein IJ466_11615 [Clostridia bacterium]|nr:hypothetical protein [Clostridia bacterium]
MSNRAQRRADARQEQKENAELRMSGYFKAKTKIEAVKQKKMDELQRNGITLADLQANYDKGFHDGFKKAAEPIVRGCYAGVCLALNDLYGFGHKRCADVLNALDQHITMTLSTVEAIDEVWNRMGLKLDFKDPFERIQEA